MIKIRICYDKIRFLYKKFIQSAIFHVRMRESFMKSAMYQKQLINLEQLNRFEYQFIYDEGKNGKLSCPVCGEMVRLYLGIHHPPHFFHLHSETSACQDCEQTETTVQETSSEYVEQNGFRIPKSRAIVATPVEKSHFRKARKIKVSTSFNTTINEKSEPDHAYLQQLLNSRIKLDSNQQQAVTHIDGPLLVLAGAGSGKTRVLTTRAAFMLNEKNIPPNNMMLVTFTAKAAAEMKARLLHYPNVDRRAIQSLVVGTFHSIFYRILSFHFPNEWSHEQLLKFNWQKEKILKNAGKQLGFSEQEFAYDLALQQIGFWKNSLITPKQMKPNSEWEEKVAKLYTLYEEHKQQHAQFDFDDMLLGCYSMFQQHPDLLERYQQRFRYFLIDEFQDVNPVQYELIKLLSVHTKNVCAVGDDDQAIYSFRGSNPQYILDFAKDFPNTKIISLNQNYRSSHEIVTTANQIIKANRQRHIKQMQAQYTDKHAPILFYPYDEEEEATMIVTDIQEKIAAGANPADFAVLFRTHSSSRALFERLVYSSLPFKIDQDSDSFYERYIVRGMISFLRLSINEEDPTAIKQILPILFMKQTVLQDVKASSILNDCTLLEALSNVKTGFAFQERKLKQLVGIVRKLKQLKPITAIDLIEKEFDFSNFLKKQGNEANKWEKGSDDVKDLKVAVRNFRSIHEFLEHVDHINAMNKEIRRQSNQSNTITLSTIHRAKGLEYKTVYVVGIVDGSLPHDYALDSARNGDYAPLEEERRLLYVAVTRAREHLYLSVPEKRRGKTANQSRFLSPLF